MSYWIYLTEPVSGETVSLSERHHMAGGTFALGGTNSAELNVTYNYGKITRQVLDPEGIRCINGKTGAETIPLLEAAAAKLADDEDTNYWAATEGNVKKMLLQLVALAKMRPDGVWRVS